MYLTTDGSLRDGIVAHIQSLYDSRDISLWLTTGERYMCYWAEADMILWLSSTWLLRSRLRVRTNDDVFREVESRLVHFLETKLEYGFYQFFSPTKSQGTLAALLNLYDFAPESRIRSLAGQVVARMLSELLLFPNEQGYFFPVTASGEVEDYTSPRFSSIMWFLTDKDPIPVEPDFVGSFLATTAFDLEEIGETWESSLSVKMTVGHPVTDLKEIHADQSSRDRILFQWSAGAYVYPEVVSDTLDMIDAYKLEDHVFWDGYKFLFSSAFRFNLHEISEMFFGFTKGSDLSGANVSVYRDGDVVLSSLERYNVQYRSRQQWVWMATVGDVAVWTQSGVVDGDFEENHNDAVNTHMPMVQQEDHVALITYRPAKDLRENPLLRIFLPNGETQVALYFPLDRFDQVEESGHWLMGRNGDNYIAVWRHKTSKTSCAGRPNSCREYFYSDPQEGLQGQSWAVVVGNSDTHGDFDDFQDIVTAGTVSEHSSGILSWLFGWGYRTELSVDGKTITSEL